MEKRPPIDEWLSLFQATVAAEGITTGPGAVAGTSIVDAGLRGAGANSFISMLMVLYPGQPLLVDSQDITAFNTVTGEVTYAGAYKGVAAAIPVGVPYKIVTFRFVPAEVAAIAAALAAHEAAQLVSRGEVTSIETKVDDVDADLVAHEAALAAHEAAQLVSRGEVTSIETKVDDVDADLVAHEAALAAHEAAQLASRGEVTSIETKVDAVEVKLDTPANFMADVAALALEATLDTHDVDIKALLATIAGYIDVEVGTIIASQGRQLFTMDFWSDPMEEIQVPAAAATLVFTETVQVAERPAGATIVRVTPMFKFRMVENTYDGPNALDGATVADTTQVMQVKETVGGAYVDAINFADNQFTLANLTREGGDVLIGSIDIAGEVDDNDNYTFQWKMRKCDSDFINFNDCQVGLRILYSV